MARDLLMMLPLLNLAPTPMPQPTPGTVTMGGEDTEVTMVVTTDHMLMATMARDLPMMLPLLNLAPTPMLILQPTPGMDTTGMGTTGLTVMVTTGLDTGVTTGDKKWTSRTTSDLSLPTHL